jgi:mycoredoxin
MLVWATPVVAPQCPATVIKQRTFATMVTMYTTTWCGYCRRLKDGLDRAGVPYHEIDIEEVEGAAEIVMSVNGGNQTVPTLVFPDGSALTNPSVAEVRSKLAA